MKSWRTRGPKNCTWREPCLPGLAASCNTSGPRSHKRRPSSPGETALIVAKARLGLVFAAFSLFFLVVSGRMAILTIGNEPSEPTLVEAASGQMPVTARADILDRNGTILATSLPTVMLMANTPKIIDFREAAQKIASVLTDLDPEKLEQQLRDTKHYITLRRQLTPRQYYAINKLGIAGLEFMPDEGRIYPAGSVTSHVLGFTDVDNIGIAGMEKGLNEQLQNSPDPIRTTLDIRLQTILHREMANAVDEFQAIGGTGIIMDVTNGEILSLVSLPDFEPQNVGKAPPDARFNRATLGVYEMGSTFKMFNTAMALDSGLIKPAERFDTIHPIEIGSKRIRDFHPSNHWLNVAEIFMESSNIGSARMADRIGTAHQKTFLNRLGLTKRVSIELPEIGSPLVPSDSSWRETTTMTIAFGHGIAVNAVQLVSAAAAIINGGYPVRPTLLAGTAPIEPDEQSRVISARTSAQMRALMRLVVSNGTAKKAEVNGYLVGGKTGTADKLTGRHYSENARMSSFLGVFPLNAPRYAVFVLLDDPKGNAKTYGFATGGWTAAPAVGRVISQIGPLLNLPPVEADVIATTERQVLRPLGNDVLESLNLDNGTDDYASVESNNAR